MRCKHSAFMASGERTRQATLPFLGGLIPEDKLMTTQPKSAQTENRFGWEVGGNGSADAASVEQSAKVRRADVIEATK